jgi:hypothetical protein
VLVVLDDSERTFRLLVKLRVEARIMNFFAGLYQTSLRYGIILRTYPPIVIAFVSLLCVRQLLPRN